MNKECKYNYIAEINLEKKLLVEGKNDREDDTQPEVLKRCDMDAIILSSVTTLWSMERSKVGNLRLAGNYGGIGLSSITA